MLQSGRLTHRQRGQRHRAQRLLPRAHHEDPGLNGHQGSAGAQHRGIIKVEVRIDDQPWQTATLATWDNPDTWRQWRLDWQATPGDHRIEVRATDGTGTVQTETVQGLLPDGATGHHHVLATIS